MTTKEETRRRLLWRGAREHQIDFDRHRWTRIVWESKSQWAYVHIETSNLDELGHESWTKVDGEKHLMAGVLALALLDALGARPPDFDGPVTEIEPGRSETAKWVVIQGQTLRYGYPEKHMVRLSVAELPGLDPERSIVRTVLEDPYIDAAGVVGWKCYSWPGCGHEREPHVAAEDVLAHVLAIHYRLTEDDDIAPGSGLVAPTRYVSCSCGASRSDQDYELLVCCRHCEARIGPAQ